MKLLHFSRACLFSRQVPFYWVFLWPGGNRSRQVPPFKPLTLGFGSGCCFFSDFFSFPAKNLQLDVRFFFAFKYLRTALRGGKERYFVYSCVKNLVVSIGIYAGFSQNFHIINLHEREGGQMLTYFILTMVQIL